MKARPKPALQLYTMRFVIKDHGLDVALKQCADAGYDALETSNLFAGNEPGDVKRWFKDFGFRCAGLHGGIAQLDDLDSCLGYMEQMETPYLICSGVGDYKSKGLEAYHEAADKFMDVGQRLADQGRVLCYHNHSFEFQDYGGTRGIDVLFSETDPKVVKACIDTYWVRHGEDDPVDFIERHSDRVAILHLKDYKDGKFADVGDGEIDFTSVIELGSQYGVEWATVENDQPRDPAIESIRISRRYMREELGI